MEREPKDVRPRTILLLEDNSNLNQMIRDALNESFAGGVRLIPFYDSASAVGFLEDNAGNVDLIITCRLLHKGNGIKFLDECRKLDPDLPVLLHTALVCKDKFSPFDACIEKQPGFAPLIEALSRILKI